MPQRRWFSWLTLSLWIAGALIVGRVVAVIANETSSKPGGSQALELCLWRMRSEATGLLGLALLFGALSAGLAIWIARRRMIALARFAAILAIATTLHIYILRGWTLAEPPDLADPFGPFKLAGFLPLLGVALALGLLVAVSAFAIRYDTTGETPFADLPGLLLGIALVAVGPLFVSWWSSSAPPYLTWFEPAHDLLAEQTFEVRRQNPNFSVRIGHVDPVSGLSERDPRERQALILPPPAEVVFTTPADAGELVLRASVAIDGAFPAGDERMTVRFTVAIDGVVVYTQDLAPERGMDASLLNWRSVRGGGGDFVLEPGSEVVLSTRVVKPVGVRAEDLPLIPAGFAELVLEGKRQKMRRRASDDAPNLLLIVLDSLRADRLSCYGHTGYAEPLTPHIDALAARGTLYENAYADASWTEASLAALLTGLGSERHGLVGARASLDEARETLAEALARERYMTAAWGGSSAIVERGFDQGFDHFSPRTGGEQLEKAVAAWVEQSRDTPFFLYLHCTDTRVKYKSEEAAREFVGARRPVDFPDDPRQELIDEGARLASGALTVDGVLTQPQQAWLKASYDVAVRAADGFVGRVLALIEELELDERTIVVVTSDHGEELLDHGFVQHGHDLWEELVHVPLILAGPGIPVARRVATPVANRHVASTLARRVGATLREVDDGLDLARPETLAAEPVFYTTLQALRSDPRDGRTTAEYGVRDGRWSAIWAPEGGVGAPALRLYDLEADPRQTLDLRAEEQQRALELRELLARHFAALIEPARVQEVELAPAGEPAASDDPLGR